jgi:two-component system sensor histidine kinase TctE
LVGTLSGVALALGAGGAWLINGIVERTADRLLGSSARAIAETLAVEDGEISLDIPASALGMLENNARDNVYYSVTHQGRLVTGYPDLPIAKGPLPLEVSSFRYEGYRGARIRIAAEARRLPRIPGSVVVEVAETLDARRELARRMLLGLAALEAALVGVVALLVWPAVRWGLAPLTAVRAELDFRPADQIDFTPLSMGGVPTELSGLVSGFNALLNRLEGAVEGMRRFTADASHQMRTPLAILRTHLALLRKNGTETEAGRTSLADLQLATDRLQGLLTGLIALARTEDVASGQPGEAVDVRAISRQALIDLAPLASAHGVDLRLEGEDAPVPARADPVLLSEIATNLVDNAIRYNHRGGHVAVRVDTDGVGVTLQVEDDGPGVPAEAHDKIFQRFYRLPRDQQSHGSGLGLSIVRAAANRLGAELRLEPGAAGAGLRVTLALPAHATA